MNLMALMSNLGSIQEAAAPAMREIAETKALAGESVRLQRDILQAIRDQNDLLKGIFEWATQQGLSAPMVRFKHHSLKQQ